MLTGHGDDTYRYTDIRMNFSSNIYPHADLAALEQHLCSRIDCIRTYPQPTPTDIEAMIAAGHGISADTVMLTAGATDAIYLISQTLRHLKTFRTWSPTFSEYADACHTYGYTWQQDGAVAWLCNPNNPDGHVTDADTIKALAHCHQWLVIDQSYEDYTLQPMLTATDALQMERVVQVRSMTKRYAVPGLRLGYIIAPAALIHELRQNYRPWTINSVGIEAARWLLQHDACAIPDIKAYIDEAMRLRTMLNGIEGINMAESDTSFMLGTIKPATAARLKDYLATHHGMLIRDASNFDGLTPHHFRIATSSPTENNALADAIKTFVNLTIS